MGGVFKGGFMLEDVLIKHGGVEVDAMTVYTDMFHLGEGLLQRNGEPPGLFKGNALGYYRGGKAQRGHYRILFDDTFEETLKELQEADFAIINGITYYGRRNTQEHACKMWGMIFDLDGVTDWTLDGFCNMADFGRLPVPNYIALSGHGVHLYYLFEYGIPLYPNIKLQLKAFKYALLDRLWTEDTSTLRDRQYQGINQGFRPIGGKTKIPGVRVRAFRMNQHPYNLEQLGQYIPESSRVDETKLWRESKMTLSEAKARYPEWYEAKVVKKQARQYWTVKRDLYDWWKRQIEAGATFHHRYFDIMCLAIYAAKCGIDEKELKSDAYGLIPFMNNIHPEDPFTRSDVKSALECFDSRYCTFPRDDIAKISGIPIVKNKRNGRKQETHLRVARGIKTILKETGDMNPEGRPSKRNYVERWRQANPEKSKADCIKETGLSKPTVYKYWNGGNGNGAGQNDGENRGR